MAVAEKKVAEGSAGSLFDRLSMASLAGVVYVLGTLGVVFRGVPALWSLLDLPSNTFLTGALLGLTCLAVLVVLAIVGGKLLGPNPRPGIKAGIFLGIVFLLLVTLLTRWVAGILENYAYENRWFAGSEPVTGGILTAVIFALFFFLLFRIYFRRTFEERMVRFEEQGWFTARSYKPGQGSRVRRGTILGILLLAGSGIWVMINHRVLDRGPANWSINIPFTGTMIVESLGDYDALPSKPPEEQRNTVRIDSKGDVESLSVGATSTPAAVSEAMKPILEQKREKLKPILSRLKADSTTRDTQRKTAQDPKLKNRLSTEITQLNLWIDALTGFDRRLAGSADQFLLQRDLEKWLAQEQDTEKKRIRELEARRTGSEDQFLLQPETVVYLQGRLKEIAAWVKSDRLPVALPVFNRFVVRDLNVQLDPKTHRLVTNPDFFAELKDDQGKPPFAENEIISQEKYEEAVAKLKATRKNELGAGYTDAISREIEQRAAEAARPTQPISGQILYASIPVLPGVKFTVPLLMLALTLWLAWRIVNHPTFADFLISTEGELNKVSWTTRARLWQDTVVVLTTVVVMALFLFIVDLSWAKILSWKPIGVLRVAEPDKKSQDLKDLKW